MSTEDKRAEAQLRGRLTGIHEFVGLKTTDYPLLSSINCSNSDKR